MSTFILKLALHYKIKVIRYQNSCPIYYDSKLKSTQLSCIATEQTLETYPE